jgi:hypothetical protein
VASGPRAGSGQPPTPQQPPATPPATLPAAAGQPAAGEPAVLVGAGDIANCDLAGGGGALATARVLDGIPGTIFTLGDHAYPAGSANDFKNCYDKSWGRHKARTRPTPGNHDYGTSKAAAYFDYFGENAGPDRRGYYSFELGAWHIISLNSYIGADGRSSQVKWLKEDLAAHPSACTLAYWHIPVFSSGAHGNDPHMVDVWKALYEAKADVVLNGHDHDYERFAPQDWKAKSEPDRGIRAFVVGTGGGGVYRFKKTRSNSEVRNDTAYGVLKLTLMPTSYQWEFVPGVGTFKDSGTGQCVQ